ncbi:MAG: S41 family peptidase [Burkholderiaceae bacterium]
MEIGTTDEGARVVEVLEGSPAERAGVRKGEALIRIDDHRLSGRPLAEIIKLLRGTPSSVVNLELRDSGTGQTRAIVIKREIILLRPVHIRPIAPDIVYIRVTQFTQAMPKQVSDGLADAMKDDPSPKGIILDLRSSSGGLLDASIALAAAFLPENALVADLKGQSEESTRRFQASAQSYRDSARTDPLASLPAEARTVRMAVLVGEKTASGAEAVAAALQDHKRAAVIGTRTFGKGTVESVYPLQKGGAIKLTTASLYRPNGSELEFHGITPDVTVSAASDTPARTTSEPDPALAQAIRLVRR